MRISIPTRRWSVLALLLVLLVQVGYAQRKVTMRYHLKEGQSYTLVNSITQTIDQNIQGMQQNSRQTILFEFDCMAEKVRRNGSTDMNFHYQRVKFAAAGDLINTEYDSADPESEPNMQTMAFAALVGQQLAVQMSDRGEIVKIDGVDAILDNMLDMYGITAEAQRRQIRGTLASQFSDKALKNQFVGLSLVFPEYAIGVGDSWQQKMEVNSGFPLVLNTTYTVLSMDNNVMELSVKSDIISAPNMKPVQMNGQEIVYDLSGTQEGITRIDMRTGWTLDSNAKQDIAGTVEIIPNAQIPEGISWPIIIKSDIEVLPKEQ